MTREEMMALNVNELVLVKGSGKVYRVRYVDLPYTAERNAEIEADMAAQRATKGYYSGPCPGFLGAVSFIQQRNGADYGPIRHLKPENIERAS
jgi:hypothetical protein